jgi:hypothetical protein
MLTKTTGYLDSDGCMHATVEAAQKAELNLLLGVHVHNTAEAADVADAILANADAIIAILTTGPRSKAKTRKAPGTTNPRRAMKRQRATEAEAQAGFTAMREAANGELVPAAAD